MEGGVEATVDASACAKGNMDVESGHKIFFVRVKVLISFKINDIFNLFFWNILFFYLSLATE
ncbi:hypothetical protein HMPREF1870_00729 [Bacteroidales bacterium KA00344]|nr:hypothetical protein HMPREF1870_00729 [Bacteroidales bacterium KA00344]